MNELHEMLISLILEELFIYYCHHILQNRASKSLTKKKERESSYFSHSLQHKNNPAILTERKRYLILALNSHPQIPSIQLLGNLIISTELHGRK